MSYRVTDPSGNAATASSFVSVPLQAYGTTDPIKLVLETNSRGTLLRWEPVPGAFYYNAIRGLVGNFQETQRTIDLGHVLCLESRSTDTTTEFFEDAEDPAPGTAFFYLVEYNDGLPSTYGSESTLRPRVVGSGDCM